MAAEPSIPHRLAALIERRKLDRPPNSYTTRLLDGGMETIAAKVREEAAELIDAASRAEPKRPDIVHEAADLFYHVLVLLAHGDVKWSQVESELARRFGTSGLDEKASRTGG